RMATEIIQPTPDVWDRFVEEQNGHILQTSRWGALKEAFGWRAELVALADGGRICAGALVLFRPLPLGLGSIAYIPRGPVVDWSDGATVQALLSAIDERARRQGAILLKVEPDERDTVEMRERLTALGFRESPQTVQPPRTILIDISDVQGDPEGDDEVLMRMSGTCRRKVRVAYRKNIKVRECGVEDVATYARLANVTGERNDFGVHSEAYYRKAYELFAPEHAALLMASYDGKDVAGLFVFAFGRTAWYFYGASSNEERNRMPTYALQWEAMNWARARGCTVYDMWGIPDAPEEQLEAEFQHRQDGLWGVYGFKRGFGGEVVRAVGAWDRIYRPLLGRAYDVAIRLRGLG
ncbi:MAG TPA: peptidoglycan bridge formation glycyltransferase FemA/FemB family protein, partial [Aggregatilineales bacterium]|nr:peptidoglycan bridge formation glycyltransferase FemA/FemB family protein [Aggregatilineales bacterium]